MDHLVEAPPQTFDLDSELAMIKSENAWQSGKRNAVTLLNNHKMRIVLVTMREGASTQEHRVDCPISLQMVEGEIKFRADSHDYLLKKGQLLTLRPGIIHGIHAVMDSAYLLTLATNESHPAA